MKAPQHQAHRKAKARLRLARDRIARADYGSAILFLRSALKRLEKEPTSASDRAQCYIELARCYNLRGEHELAIPYCRWATNLLAHEWDTELPQAEAEMEMGIALMHTGDWRQAQRHLVRSYQTFEAHQLWAKAARCVENMGILAKRQEQTVRAINAFSYARYLYRQIEDLAGVQRTETQLRELIPED